MFLKRIIYIYIFYVFLEKFPFRFIFVDWRNDYIVHSSNGFFRACVRACIRVRVYLHSPFSVVYSPPLSPLSSIFLQKEHGCALRPDLASTEIKSAGINTAYQCTKGKHNFLLTPFSITRTPTVHFHGSSNLWTFQTSFSFFLRMIFKKFKFNSFETFFSSMQRSFFRTEK